MFTQIVFIKGDNPLLQARNCFITPHIAWAPRESRQRLMDIAVANLKSFIDGSLDSSSPRAFNREIACLTELLLT